MNALFISIPKQITMKNLTQGVTSTFKQSPLLTVLTAAFTAYIASLITLAVIVTIAPQSTIGTMVDNLF